MSDERRGLSSENRRCPACNVELRHPDLILRVAAGAPAKGLTVILGRLITCPACGRTLGVVRYLEDP